jgi:hypothetical protein
MFVHLAKAKRDKKRLDLDPDFHDIMESASTKDYIYRASDNFFSLYHLLSDFPFLQPWTELGNKLTETSIAISLAEKEVLQMLRLEVSVWLLELPGCLKSGRIRLSNILVNYAKMHK